MTPKEMRSQIHRLLVKSAQQQDTIDRLENELYVAKNRSQAKEIRNRGYLLEPVDNSVWG